MYPSVTIIVGGVGTDETYFQNYTQKYKLSHFTRVFSLQSNCGIERQAEQLLDILHFYKSKSYIIHCVGFSIGCMLLMKVLEVPMVCDKVTFVNPCNLALDRYRYRYRMFYKLLWFMPRCIKNVYLIYYEKYIAHAQEEPVHHMRYLLSKPFTHWDGIIKNIGESVSWGELIIKGSFHKRIKIIHGRKDRYLAFGKFLDFEYNDKFQCRVIDGQHHLFHNKSNELFHFMK